LRQGQIGGFEEELHHLCCVTRLPLGTLPVLLSDIAGILMQEARRTVFEDLEEVTFDPDSIRQELLRMGHNRASLSPERVRLLLEFFLMRVVDPAGSWS